MNATSIDQLLFACHKEGIPIDFGLVLRREDYDHLRMYGGAHCNYRQDPKQPWTNGLRYRGIPIECEFPCNEIRT